MKVNRITAQWDVWLLALAVTLALLVIVLISCSDSTDGVSPSMEVSLPTGWGPGVEVFGEMVSYTECIWFFAPVTETVVQWEYDGNGTLYLRHFAAGFNCCPEPACSISVVDKSITVFEGDNGTCFCQCLIDIDYQITGLSPGKYQLAFDEAVDIGDGAPLEGEIMLKPDGSSGTLVVTRTVYPWDGPQPIVTGLVSYSECGGSDADYGNCPPDNNCLIWNYDGYGMLSLFHQNGVFNCCPDSLMADIAVSNDTVYIEESEAFGELGGCDCICPYDLEMMIDNLPSGEYTVVLIGPYMDEPVIFEMDLASKPSGFHCWEKAIENPFE